MDKNPNVYVREISSDLDVSIGTIRKVLHKELGLRNTSVRWVPKMLISEQKIIRFLVRDFGREILTAQNEHQT